MDIIKLAKKVELWSEREGIEMVIGGENELKEFANLVLEEAAKKCEEGIDNTGNWDSDYWNRACENRAIAIRKMKTKEE